MSTNYYLHKPSTTQCNHCGHDPESENNIIHIGKSSHGWCFALHVYPELDINTLEDWKVKWAEEGVKIKNENGDDVLPVENTSPYNRTIRMKRRRAHWHVVLAAWQLIQKRWICYKFAITIIIIIIVV